MMDCRDVQLDTRRALRNNDKEISLDYKRPKRNACKESHNSNMNNNFLLDNDNAKVVNKRNLRVDI